MDIHSYSSNVYPFHINEKIMNNKRTSRTHQAISNSIYGIVASLINVVLNLVVRIVIVHYLGDQINGLHSLFISTISVLALVETGFSTAMIIHLYEPIRYNNVYLIAQLLNFYKIIYRNIAFIFLFLGIIVDLFFIKDIVTTTISFTSVRIYFLLFATSFFINYLTFYKRSLLFADQKNRISMMATTCSELIFRGLAIVLAILSHMYILFLVCLIFEKAFSNLLCIKYVDKHYPEIIRIKAQRISADLKSKIYRTVKPLMVNQLSNTVQKTSTSILISALLGNVAIVGYYGSYQLVTSTIELLMAQLGGAFTSGFGNLAAEKNHDSMLHNYKKATFIIGFIAILSCSIIAGCVQDIILLLFGKNFILSPLSVFLIISSSFVGLLSIPVISVQNAMGLHHLDAKQMIIQAFSAVLLGYVLGKWYGMVGILLGGMIPLIIFTLIRKGIIINITIFDVSSYEYIKCILVDVFKFVICIILCYITCNMITVDSLYLRIFLKFIFSSICGFSILSLFSFRNKFYLEYINTIKTKIYK